MSMYSPRRILLTSLAGTTGSASLRMKGRHSCSGPFLSPTSGRRGSATLCPSLPGTTSAAKEGRSSSFTLSLSSSPKRKSISQVWTQSTHAQTMGVGPPAPLPTTTRASCPTTTRASCPCKHRWSTQTKSAPPWASCPGVSSLV